MHEAKSMNAPQWRIWLVTALLCGWGMLGMRFVQKEQWPMVLLCLLLMLSNGVTLWRLTKKGK